MNNTHIDSKVKFIDALRGIAILLVVMVHTMQHNPIKMPDFFVFVLSLCSRGVQLFFITSAITLFLSYNRRSKSEQNIKINFYLRRFFRIAPMYYLAICYFLFQDGFGPRYWLGDQTNITEVNIFSNFTFLNGCNPYWITSLVPGGWSITVEMMFYLFIPFIIRYVQSINQAFNFIIFTLLFKLILQEILLLNPFNVLERLWREYLYFYFPSQLPVFAFGIFIYFLIFKNSKITEINLNKWLILLILIVLQIGFNKDILFLNHIVFTVILSVFVYFLSKGKLNFFINKISLFLGKISYSLYFVHFAILFWLQHYNLLSFSKNYITNYFCILMFVLILSSFISLIFHKIIEINFQLLGNKFINKLK